MDSEGTPIMKLTLPNHLEADEMTLWPHKSLKMKP